MLLKTFDSNPAGTERLIRAQTQNMLMFVRKTEKPEEIRVMLEVFICFRSECVEVVADVEETRESDQDNFYFKWF